jgi:hypothetical protein
MRAPDGKVTLLAGFVIGIAISGLWLFTPSRDTVTIRPIELREHQGVPTGQPSPPAATDPGTALPTGPGSPSPTGNPDPESDSPDAEPARTPTVVTPAVVWERPTAPPRATPHPTPDDAPEETDEPEVTDEPEETDEPEVTDEPEDPGG